MTYPMIRTRADYNPKMWQLGYQTSQYGTQETGVYDGVQKLTGVTNTEPVTSGSDGETGSYYLEQSLFGDGVPSDISVSLANPPADMVVSATAAIDTAIAVTPNQ